MARFAELHDGTRLEFPDGTSDEVIQSTVKRVLSERMPAAPPKGLDRQPDLKAQGAQLPTAARGFINAAQGPLFGFADELGAGVAAGIDRVTGRNPGMSFGDLYGRYRDVARGASEQYQRDNPIVAPVGQVAASLPLFGVTKAFEQMLPAAGRMGVVRNAAMTGGAMGALGGAGNAETLADVPADAGMGAATGAIISGGVSGVGQSAGAMAQNVVARGANSRIVQDRLRDGGVGGAAARAVFGNADDLARSRVATALTRDNSGTGQAAARLRKLGPEATLADAGGKNTRDLLDTMAIMPGRTGDRVETMIRGRQVGRPGRMVEGAAGLAGGRQLPEELAALTRQQADNATPLYNAIRDIPVAADDRLQRILRRPVIQDAIAQARVAAANADEVLPDIRAGEAVSMATWDRIKRGLDDVIGLKKRGVDAGTANNAAKSTLSDAVRTKQELLGVLDDLVPDYKRARDAFSGPAALKDAMEEGRSLFATKPMDLRAMLDGMTVSERDAFRVGAMQALREKVGTESGQTAVLKFWKEPATRERLQAVFPNTRTYRQFEAALLGEGQLKLLEQVGRGAQTAPRQARMDDEAAAFLGGAVDAGAALKTGNPASVLSAVRNLYGRSVMPEPVRDRIGDMLLQRGPQAQGLLGDLSRYVDDAQARRAAAAARSGLLGGVGINSLLGN